ncbi:MAG: F0F1 ATP synthase subunit delta, partial [Sediminibacterium sp.]|nr:F0F1 ATP synthase subunit delta [Sediminibacterium sp.]
HTIQFTTATPIDESLVNKITTKLQSEKNIKHVHVETNLDLSLIGGFVIEFDNQQLDASIKKDLNDIKKQFQKNEFIQTIK